MPIRFIPLEQIKETHLQQLITDNESEKRELDYKRELDEAGGVPVNLVGIDIPDFDKLKLNINNILSSNIKPRILGIDYQPVSLSNGKYALIIRVPKSYSAPHAINVEAFFNRHAPGKLPMDITAIRAAFEASTTLTERIRSFRIQQIEAIKNCNTFMPLTKRPQIVLFLIPFVSLEPGTSFPLKPVFGNDNLTHCLFGDSDYRRYNLDGVFKYKNSREENNIEEYFQFYRNGVIEVVSSSYMIDHISNSEHELPIRALELAIKKNVGRYFSLYRELEIAPPVLLYISLHGFKDYKGKDSRTFGTYNKLGRDDLHLPEILIDDINQDSATILKPAFDALWNATGREGSPSYDESGNWKEEN
jgi:hypothetical protein